VTRVLAGIIALALLGLLAWGFFVEPYRLEVVEVEVRDPYFARALAGVRVVQVSDLHLGRPGGREEDLLRLLARLKPDLLLLTGDYVEWRGDYQGALDLLSRLEARLGVFGVLGDYDWSRSRNTCLFCHQPGSAAPTKRHRVRFLKGEGVRLAPHGQEVWVSAFDPEAAEEREGEPGRLRVERPTIMLLHNPLLFDRLEAAAPLLALAGDTHGGQVWLPRLFWRAVGYKKCVRYRAGLFERGRARLYVNRGIGTSHLPLRLGVPPEVTVLRFVE
jgi:hypothetical protein